MSARVLVLSAGSGAANNLIIGLRAALQGAVTIGAHHDPFTLKNSRADRNYLLNPTELDAREISRIAARESVDVVMPTTEAEVACLSEGREELVGRLFLPSVAVIKLCQDKYDLNTFLKRQGVPVPISFPVTSPDDLDHLFKLVGEGARAWCRARVGSGSRGAGPVASARQARAWLEHWYSLRGLPPRDFMLAEYLPGRQFFCQSIWHAGRLVLVMTCETLSHYGAENSLSGTSSLFSLAKTVRDDRIVGISVRALRALDPLLSGAFSIDLKENLDGVPCVTEINAGRIVMGMTTIGEIGAHSMSACFVRLAQGIPATFDDPYDCPPDYYVVRDVDSMPGVFHADTVFDDLIRLDR